MFGSGVEPPDVTWFGRVSVDVVSFVNQFERERERQGFEDELNQLGRFYQDVRWVFVILLDFTLVSTCLISEGGKKMGFFYNIKISIGVNQ